MKKVPFFLVIACLLASITYGMAFAQPINQLELGYSRDFGYGGFGNDIQGIFTLKIKNPPASLAKVEFFIDSKLMGDDVQAPFTLQFSTDSYPLGGHTLSAKGYLPDGTQIGSNVIQVQFVPASAATGAIVKVIVPIIGLLVIIALVAVGMPLIFNRGKLSKIPLGTPRNYGIGGGGICPKCGRPFPLRLWWINLGTSKIDRCPYCGKWSFVRPRPLAELRAAEAAELARAQPETAIVGETEAEKLKREIDDSRFRDV